jgi:hypothetical protein
MASNLVQKLPIIIVIIKPDSSQQPSYNTVNTSASLVQWAASKLVYVRCISVLSFSRWFPNGFFPQLSNQNVGNISCLLHVRAANLNNGIER